VHGSAAPVLDEVSVGPNGAAQFALAEDGSLVFAKGVSGLGRRTLVWIDREGREEAVNVPPRSYTYARLSPDDTRVALDARDQQNDIWIWYLLRGTLERLTSDPGLNRLPVWTRDGKRVAFTSDRDGTEGIYWQAADASGTAERLSPEGFEGGPSSFSPDGTRLVFLAPLTGPGDLGILTLAPTQRTDMLFNDPSFSETNGEVSPDGQWLAYESEESGRAEIYLRPFPDVHASRRLVSTGGGTRPLWSRNGRELFYYVAPDTIMAVPVKAEKELELGRPTVALKGGFAVAVNAGRHYDVSRDGRRFLLLKDVDDAEARDTPQLVIWLHWSEELKRLVPTN
jgi:serine/threonine-protein kinase